MALILQTTPSSCPAFTTNKPHILLHTPKYTRVSIKSEQQQESTSGSGPSAKKPGNSPPSAIFGSLASSSTAAAPAKKKQSKGKRERASIIRREPVEKPSFATAQEAAQVEELRKNESAFLLAWLGLGAIILIQGIALAASGFLPDAWDSFFVKYVYPSFTPTVFLFVAGTVAYGVLKYLQNESSESEN